jgi:cell division protein FtsN
VQVSSQRSADQARATFANMKRRYKSVLGGFEPDIQRADLGAKGTYYRVRIGPMASRGAALRLCEQLKSAGGNCFVTR